ncbi:CDP-alcohol phosphatidyltransferase family protein [Micromonospora sp. NPDC049366]|uniref:CDP-alcohol phosphatidyltransferase family protein n=1 Tax=Micromonospora sp. NPDC049366 TaxID=3364271 RepID=UPI0037BB735D
MPTVRNGPLVGLGAQLVLLAVLAGTVGVGAAGLLVGATYGVVTGALLTRGLRRADATRLGPADRVTLTRAMLVGAVTALTVDAFRRPAPVALLVTLTAVALLLDWVDGRVARRTGTVSALGARFDMEVDAFLLMVLCAYVAPDAGAWVLTLGGMRYAFVAAGWALPWMRGTLPPRPWRKVVAATQGVVLAVAAAGLLPGWATRLLLAAALVLLVESFGRDVRWLWRHRAARPRPVRSPAPVAADAAAAAVAEAARVAARRAPVGAIATRPPAVVAGGAPAPTDRWLR